MAANAMCNICPPFGHQPPLPFFPKHEPLLHHVNILCIFNVYDKAVIDQPTIIIILIRK